jgi:hypothetical protein
MGPDGFGDPGAAGCPPDDPPGTMPVQPAAVQSEEDRSFGAFADGQVDRPGGARCERDSDDLAALAGYHQGSVAALDTESFDVGAGGFGDPQSVQREQGDQRVLRRRAEPGGDQEGAELVAVQPGGVRLVVQPRPADVRGGRVVQQLFLDGVPVEPRHRAQAAGDGGPGPATSFQIAGEELDVGPADLEEVQLVLLAPAHELPQIQLVGLPGEAAVPGQEPR